MIPDDPPVLGKALDVPAFAVGALDAHSIRMVAASAEHLAQIVDDPGAGKDEYKRLAAPLPCCASAQIRRCLAMRQRPLSATRRTTARRR